SSNFTASSATTRSEGSSAIRPSHVVMCAPSVLKYQARKLSSATSSSGLIQKENYIKNAYNTKCSQTLTYNHFFLTFFFLHFYIKLCLASIAYIGVVVVLQFHTNNQSMEDALLWRSFREGSKQAFEALFTRYY